MTSPSPREISLREIAERSRATLEGDPDLHVRGVAGLEDAQSGDLSFLALAKYAPHLAATCASALFLPPGVTGPEKIPVLRTPDPYGAFVRILPLFAPPGSEVHRGVHPSAVVGEGVILGRDVGVGAGSVIERDVELGERTTVHAGVVIGRGSRIGCDCILYPRVVVTHANILGDRVIVHSGTVIGADGFGYAALDGGFQKVPQVGNVVIEDDVEIGANSCIDRATVGSTRIGRGSKIDNLVQVAHNVVIGEGCALVAQAGVAGSTRIGKGVRLGGQSGLAGHIRIGDGASIGGQAGVIGDISAGETVSGYPARPHREVLRAQAALLQLPKLLKRLKIALRDVQLESNRSSED